MSKEKITLDFAFSLFAAMQKDNLGYIYRGIFTQKITDNILSLTENNLEKAEPSSKVKKRVYSIMVECLQNITRHQEEGEEISSDRFGLFVIQKKEEKYFITTGNVVDKLNIPPIKQLLEKINSLEKEELKSYYKQVLLEGELSDKGGAGLGLIDMARKSGNKLAYDFTDISDSHAFFYLHTVPSLSAEDEESVINNDSLQNIIDIHSILNNENVLLIFNGNFNQETLINLLSTLEGQMSGTASLKKKVFYITVEMLQNIFKHGDSQKYSDNGNPGIFFIGDKGGGYQITTGNFLRTDKVEDLRKKIEYVNNLNQTELDAFYNKRLFNFEIDDSKKAGLGIIDLRLKCGKELRYDFHIIDKDYSFFTFQAIVKK